MKFNFLNKKILNKLPFSTEQLSLIVTNTYFDRLFTSGEFNTNIKPIKKVTADELDRKVSLNDLIVLIKEYHFVSLLQKQQILTPTCIKVQRLHLFSHGIQSLFSTILFFLGTYHFMWNATLKKKSTLTFC